METKSPTTTSVNSREIIGVDQFSQRREVFGKYETVFLPQLLDTAAMPVYKEVEPIITSNHAFTASNFKRNAPGYSSMRESREDYNFEFRPRKYSDNFTSELNQSSDVDYRHSMTERTRRLSKLRRDFLNSNLHEPTIVSPFARTGVRASMPATSVTAMKYKIESPNLYKFPFAEPYSTPPPLRRVVVDFGPAQENGEKENQNPEAGAKSRHQSLPHDVSPKIDHQKLFEELVKRYSPQRKPVNWNLPPTRPRVVGSVPKSTTSMADSVDSGDKKGLDDTINKFGDDDVFIKKESNMETIKDLGEEVAESKQIPKDEQEKGTEIKQISPQNDFLITNTKEDTYKAELDDNNDEISGLSAILNPEEGHKNPSILNDLDEEITKSKLTSNDEQEKNTEINETHRQNNIVETNKKEDTNKTESEENNDQLPEMSNITKPEEDGKPLDKFTDMTIPALLEKMTEEAEGSHKKENKKVKRKRSFLDKLLGRKKGK